MRNYWSHSKFANWILEKYCIKRPRAATMKEWDAWYDAAKKKNKFAYWLVEDVISWGEDVVYFIPEKLRDLRHAINARFFGRYYAIDTGLNKWTWHEFDDRVLHGLFNMLTDFFEVEYAWHGAIMSKDATDIKWYHTGWAKLISPEYRSVSDAMNHLNWELSLKNDASWFGYENADAVTDEYKSRDDWMQPTHQAKKAAELWELYNWWKNIRPTRPDPYITSGWNAYCEAYTIGETDVSQYLDKLHEIEEAYEKEDEEMLLRLIKLRKNLWT